MAKNMDSTPAIPGADKKAEPMKHTGGPHEGTPMPPMPKGNMMAMPPGTPKM